MKLFYLIIFAWLNCGNDAGAQQPQALVGGWDSFPPFAYTHEDKGIKRWVGLDVELLHEIAKRAGYFVSADALAWSDHVELLRTGAVDIAPQATMTKERAEFANFSLPYRTDTMVLTVAKGHARNLQANTIGELVQRFKDNGFRLGITPGVAYPSPQIRDYIADPDNQETIVPLNNSELVSGLIDRKIDGFVADRIVAAHLVKAMAASDYVEEHPLIVHGDLHLMFSKASVPSEVVQRFNEAIESVHGDGTYRRLNAKYAFPILVGITLDSNWFLAVDIIGTVAFAISGLLLAFRHNYDVFGALVLAALPAVGGGVIRDLITNRGELAVFASPIYIAIIVILVVGGYFALRSAVLLRKSALGARAVGELSRWRSPINYTIQVCDAVGLAAFTVTGVVVALVTQSNPLWIWGPILAAITASGGGILRDVVRSNPEIPALKGQLYPEIAVLWGCLLSIYFIWDARQLSADDIQTGIVVTFLGVLLTRMMTIHFGWKSPRFSA